MCDVEVEGRDERLEEGAVGFRGRGLGEGAHLVLEEAEEGGGVGWVGDGVGVVVVLVLRLVGLLLLGGFVGGG